MKIQTVPQEARYGVIEHYHYHLARPGRKSKYIASIALTVHHGGPRWELHMPGIIDDAWEQPSRREAEKQMRALLRERLKRRNQKEVE